MISAQSVKGVVNCEPSLRFSLSEDSGRKSPPALEVEFDDLPPGYHKRNWYGTVFIEKD